MSTRDEAQKNDMRLMDLAMYEETKGMVAKTSQELIMQRFGYFKSLVRRGSFTIEELEDRVFTKYGLVSRRTQDQSAEEQFIKGIQEFLNGMKDKANEDQQAKKKPDENR